MWDSLPFLFVKIKGNEHQTIDSSFKTSSFAPTHMGLSSRQLNKKVNAPNLKFLGLSDEPSVFANIEEKERGNHIHSTSSGCPQWGSSTTGN